MAVLLLQLEGVISLITHFNGLVQAVRLLSVVAQLVVRSLPLRLSAQFLTQQAIILVELFLLAISILNWLVMPQLLQVTVDSMAW